ncbi:unnamed protein product [Schistosoma rodhaini]|uniref:Uncharacterized protein n=1 Tax=Schistosoma rodhaini TaxID=6188 RepID=A0AA85EM80_9TREM|nr:unnamed protein product [Schistosoma rodhaini]
MQTYCDLKSSRGKGIVALEPEDYSKEKDELKYFTNKQIYLITVSFKFKHNGFKMRQDFRSMSHSQVKFTVEYIRINLIYIEDNEGQKYQFVTKRSFHNL